MVEDKIKELGLTLPVAAKPLAAYIPAIRTGDLIFTAGQVPIKDGKLQFIGKIDEDLSVSQGRSAAQLCALNCLSAIKNEIGDLDKIEQIIKVTVFVSSSKGFTEQPQVANGASELLKEIFGENGKHARSAVGVSELPLNAPVEIEMIVKLKSA